VKRHHTVPCHCTPVTTIRATTLASRGHSPTGGERQGGWTPLLRVVDGIWKVTESSRTKEEDREVWVQESRMRERESDNKIISPLPTHDALHSAWCHHPLRNPHCQCRVGLGPTCLSAWVELLVTQQNKVKRPLRKSRTVHDDCCCIRNCHRERLIAHDVHYTMIHHSSVATHPWCQGHHIILTIKQKV
jgi:hypothetical protein